MKFAISSGHAEDCQGADGYINEVEEATKVTDTVAEILQGAGHTVVTFHDTISNDQSENLNRIVNWHNAQSRDLDVSVHFNAYNTTSSPMGCEVCYVTQSSLAATISDKMATAMDLPDRGAKYRSDLFFLNSTDKPAVLLEVCFVDSSTDTEHYHGNYDACCTGIAEGLAGEELDETEPPPVEKPPEPSEPPSMENRVDILGKTRGDVAVYINGSRIRKGSAKCQHAVYLNIRMTGDVVVSINGQDFHNQAPPDTEEPDHPPPLDVVQSNHKDIEATIFGGAADNEHSAYPPYDNNGNGQYLNDSDFYVSLPVSIKNYDPDNPPLVRVFKGELSGVGPVLDKGPWVINDDAYVYGAERPIAETCYLENTPLPKGSGNNAGKVPSNKAGIDLSPALAEQIGVDGKGQVSWCWESETDSA